VISTILIEDGIYGMTDFKLGVLISAGTFTYGIGKLLSGATPIHRPVTRILTCMALTSVATYSFAVSPSYSILMASWLLSRLAQSSIWTNFIVVINESFPSTSRGAAIAVLSQSFLVGDAGAKLILGALAPHIDYRGVSLVGATFMLTMTVASSKLLQPIKVSYTSPSSTAAASRSLCQRLRALASMRSFWCIALANGGTCFVREVFRDWVPLLLVDLCGTSTSAAAMLSTVFPLVGALAVLVIGFWGDKLKARGPLLVLFLLLAIASLLALTALSLESLPLSLPLTLTLIAGASLLNGPYSVLTTCTLDCCGDAANVDLLPLFQGLQVSGGGDESHSSNTSSHTRGSLVDTPPSPPNPPRRTAVATSSQRPPVSSLERAWKREAGQRRC